MFNRISSLTLAIVFFLLLFGSRGHLYLLAGALVVMIFATMAINFKRLNFTWPHLLLPEIYLIGVTGLFSLIPGSTLRIIFLICAAAVFYLLEIKLGRESHFLQNIYLLSVIAWYVSLFGFQFYFHLPAVVIVAAVFISTYLFGLQGFAGFSLPAKKYFYLILALICAEVAWGLSFWPTHFFINAVVSFSVYYLLWLFAFSAFFGKLSRQKIYWQIILIVILLILSLTTTAWRPLK